MVQLRKNEEELAQETNKRKLLFPVIAWYGIIFCSSFFFAMSCCSQLSLGMV